MRLFHVNVVELWRNKFDSVFTVILCLSWDEETYCKGEKGQRIEDEAFCAYWRLYNQFIIILLIRDIDVSPYELASIIETLTY